MSQADVAIVGVACRFPGEAKCPNALAEMLIDGKDAWSEVPYSRFNVKAFHHPSNKRKGGMVCMGGYFLKDDITTWDAPFFSMSANEAMAMDPQQRLLLEVAYESLENAGIPLEAVAQTEAACYVGAFGSNYKGIIGRDQLDAPQYAMTGCASSMMSNRISWFFNLRGPSLTVDTACSSSTAALHMACETIRSNSNGTRCAIVGGTSLLLDPDDPCAFSALGFLSPQSRCFAFDSRANGYARGEGICALVLKHMDDAIRDGDPIRAVIRATGINSDGRTAGIVLPSSEAQQRLIQSTYALAGLDPADTQYVEMHGTGTKAGDPAEMGAVKRAMVSETRNTMLYCSSVKTNIGHLEAAAGLAGIIKCVLAMELGKIPPHLNFATPNPALQLGAEGNKIVVPTSAVPWPDCESGVRRCSVNSFGFGGTNVHVVLEGASVSTKQNGVSEGASVPTKQNTSDSFIAETARPYIFVLSAPEQDAIGRQRLAHSDYISTQATSASTQLLPPLAHTLAKRRSIFQWRHAVVARSIEELQAGWGDGGSRPIKAVAVPQLVLLFTGQGAQWAGMGRELMSQPVFVNSLLASSQILRALGCSWDALTELFAASPESRIDEAEFAQPLCTVLQIALVDLLYSWSVVPVAVVGHSSGEIAAAYAVGALSRESSLKVAFHRGIVCSLAQERRPGGGMMAVGLSSHDVKPYLDQTVTLACINSPSSVTLAGDKSALTCLQEQLEQKKIFCRALRVENAYHSPHMYSVREEYLQRIAGVVPLEALHSSPRFYSTVYGRLVANSELKADYWTANLCSTVDLVSALDDMVKPSANRSVQPDIIVEVGPHSALGGPIKQFKRSHTALEHTTYHSILIRGQDAALTAMGATATLWAKGFPIDIQKLNARDEPTALNTVLTDLPSYQWNHSTSHWHESRRSKNHRFPRFSKHDLIGIRPETFNPLEPRWVNRLRLSELPWLKDHRVQSDCVFPAAGVVCAAIEAMRQLEQEAGTTDDVLHFQVSEFSMLQSLIIPNNEKGIETSLHLKRRKIEMGGVTNPWAEFSFYSCQDGETFVEHASGLVRSQHRKKSSLIDGGKELREEIRKHRQYRETQEKACQSVLAPDVFYEYCGSLGIKYGKSFQAVTNIRHNGQALVFEAKVCDTNSYMPKSRESEYLIHPAMLDALLHSQFAAVRNTPDIPRQSWVPTKMESLIISCDFPRDAGATLNGVCEISFSGRHHMAGTLIAGNSDYDAMPLVLLDGLVCRGLGTTGEQSHLLEQSDHELYASVVWKPDVEMLKDTAMQKALRESERDSSGMLQFCVDSNEIVDTMCQLTLAKLDRFSPKNIPGHLQKYIQWMRMRCDKRRELPREQSTNGTSLSNGTPLPGLTNYWGIPKLEDFVKKYPVDGPLMCHVFASLDALFAQETTPIASLMECKQFAEFYKDAYGTKHNLQAMKIWFDLKAHKTPSLRVIEIGAGTGSATIPIIKQLSGNQGSTPRFSKWVFTDISAGWFEDASNKLSEWQQYVEYKVLDIEHDPIEHGFDAESFDVVLAVNVLHATKDIKTTLRNCARLLKPNGNLILGEISNPSDLASFVFGTLPGWWAFEDGRQNGPLLKPHEWDSRLIEAGMSRSKASITDGIDGDETACRTSVIISSKLSLDESIPPRKAIVMIPEGSTETIKKLASAICCDLRNAGGADIVVQDVTTAMDDLEGVTVISLLDFDTKFLQTINEAQFEQVKHILLHSAEVLWITTSSTTDGPGHPSKRIVSGLLRSVKMEDASRHPYEMHFLKNPTDDIKGTSTAICLRLRTIWSSNKDDHEEMETVQMDERFCIPRYMPADAMNQSLETAQGQNVVPQPTKLIQQDRPLQLVIGQHGLLETLHFADVEMGNPLADDEIEMDVLACGLNFRDVLIAMGELERPSIGHEAVGIVKRVGAKVSGFSRGDRILCIQPGTMATRVRVHETSAYHVPATLKNDEAAAVPIAYCTAYQSLVEVARIQKGESVLIHTAAGGLGQALIQISKMLGAEIYCTVSTEAKKQAVVDLGVRPERIFSSRDLTFEKGIKRVTDGRGVDIVVNSLAGEALQRTWMCLAPHGRFIEVGMKDIMRNSPLDMAPFLHNVTFSSVNLESMMRDSPQGRKVMAKVLELLEKRTIDLIRPIVSYDFSDAEKAFREMQRGTHIGKLVLHFTEESQAPVAPLRSFPWSLSPDATYLLVGGLGGLGRVQAEFMAKHGARHIAFVSRSGAVRDEAQHLVARLNASGVETRVFAVDVTDKARLKIVLNDITSSMPPIRGVIQGAMVLQDTVFYKMTYSQWAAATAPKIQGSWNLHTLLPLDLDFFIMFSSLAGTVGAVSQANYAAGNTYQDALAHYRRAKGLPGLSLNLGVIRAFGYIAEHKDVAAGLDSYYITHVDEEQFFHMLACALVGTAHGGISLPAQMLVGSGHGRAAQAMRSRVPDAEYRWLDSLASYAYLKRYGISTTSSQLSTSESDFSRQLAALKSATSEGEASSVVQDMLLGKISKIISIPTSDIDVSKPIHSYGVDSLVAVELRNWLSASVGSEISIFELTSNVSIRELSGKIAGRSRFFQAGVAKKEDGVEA